MGLFDIFSRKHSLASGGVLKGTRDSHSHILFGVDDGVATLETSLKVLAYEESLGISEVWCTPHVMEDTPNVTEDLKARFAELSAAYNGSMKLHLAAEYMLDNLFEERLRERDLLTMDDDTILVETSTFTPPVNFQDIFREIQKAGYRPLLAHPERYRYLDEAGYEKLIAMGVRFQLNLPSLVRFYGETAYNKAVWLLRRGFYSETGTDCHRLTRLKEQFEREVITPEVLKLLRH